MILSKSKQRNLTLFVILCLGLLILIIDQVYYIQTINSVLIFDNVMKSYCSLLGLVSLFM